MKSTLNKYQAAGLGLLFSFLLKVGLEAGNLIVVDPREVLENVLIFAAWWAILSFVIYKIPRLWRNRSQLYKILGLLLLLLVTIVLDDYLRIPDNPISISLLIVFWLGMASLLLPSFFRKYRLPILSLYGLILLYFFYIRLGNGYFQDQKEDFINLLFISVALMLLLWLFEQWKWLKSLKTEKTQAELMMLKTQVNPHFFFNTLNNLYGLTVEKSDKAPEVVLKLSDMMRYTIYEGKKQVVSLQEEIVYLQNYIELQKLRFQKEVEIEFRDSTDSDYEISPLLFIILLENAFKHGVESLTEDAYIQMLLNARKGKIFFEIENNFDPEEIKATTGIGLENLRHRLKLTYPGRHKLKIVSEKGKYKVTLEIELT